MSAKIFNILSVCYMLSAVYYGDIRKSGERMR